MRILLLSLILLLTSCVTWTDENGDPLTTVDARMKARATWYCGPGLLGIRALARGSLAMLGVPIPDACKLGRAVIDSQADQEITEEDLQELGVINDN